MRDYLLLCFPGKDFNIGQSQDFITFQNCLFWSCLFPSFLPVPHVNFERCREVLRRQTQTSVRLWRLSPDGIRKGNIKNQF